MLSGLMSVLSGNKLSAIDIGTNSIKLAEVDMGGKRPVLKKFTVYPLQPGMMMGGEILELGGVSQSIQSLAQIGKAKSKNVCTGIAGSSVIVKKISMPKMDVSLVPEQIKWEAEQYIPFDINEISIDHHILRGRDSSEVMEVLLVAAKQEVLFRVMEVIESANLKCSVVDVAGFALANCFEANYGVMSGSLAILDIGAGVTNFVVIDDGDVVFCRDIIVGGDHFTNEIARAMGISAVEAEALKISACMGQEAPAEVVGILESSVEQVIDEIRNSFEFYSATSGGMAPLSRFYVSGGSMFIPGLVDGVSKAVGLQYEAFDPFRQISYDTKALTPDYVSQIRSISPVALGLAMRKAQEK
jgi:type IV pilus assembly protein PilM